MSESPDNTESPEKGMGVSSERIGHAGPAQVAAHGVRDTQAADPDDADDSDDAAVPPEQRPGAVEANPDGLEPVADPPSLDPRSKES
jgi:hypothetical protein